MSNAADLDQELERFAGHVPRPVARALAWLHRPGSGWVRIPVALLLVVSGVAGFLPVLGFWMIPLGVALVAQDIPFLRPPMARVLGWINRKLAKHDKAEVERRSN